MKKILLPTDFSDNSWNAIKYALHLFKDDTSIFYILNTYTPVILHAEHVMVNPSELGLGDAVGDISRNGVREIKERINKEFNNQNHLFETISTFSSLIPEIKKVIKHKVIDYIVMGTKGATGLQEVLFGSNTVHIIQKAKCPVLAIPSNYSFKIPEEILFPSDYELEFEDKHVKPIIDIVHYNNAKLDILNASFGYELSSKQLQNKQKLETYFKDISHLFHSISNQSIQEAITNFQVKNDIHFLIMINNKHSFFENIFFQSTINQIGFHLNVPFLVIPSKN